MNYFGGLRTLKIYLDNAATTRPYHGIEKLFAEHALDGWYNPSAMYPDAVEAERKLNDARKAVASAVNARPDQVIFTSGGTESSNTVAKKGWRGKGTQKLHFITSRYEHACMYGSMKELEQTGHSVTYVSPRKDGFIHAEDVAAAVQENTVLVSVMHVNNETGAINDISAIAKAVKRLNPGIMVHSDGVQGFLKIPFSFNDSQLDYYTASAHKIHGLKGTGCIIAKHGTPLKSLITGGGQERGLRSGTENTLGIYAFGNAVLAYQQNHDEAIAHMSALRQRMVDKLSAEEGFYLLSPEENFAPHILNVSFAGMRGEVLLHLLEREGIAISTGSACSSKKSRDFRIHEHLGLPRDIMEGAIRLSFCPDNTEEDIDTAAAAISAALKQFRRFVRR